MADPENAESTALIEHKVQRGTAVNRQKTTSIHKRFVMKSS